jgi:hypothetical protein
MWQSRLGLWTEMKWIWKRCNIKRKRRVAKKHIALKLWRRLLYLTDNCNFVKQ